MAMKITTLAEIPDPDRVVPEIRHLFFLTSPRRRFDNERERDGFFRRWTGFYLEQAPDRVFLCLEDARLLGYLTGCDDSQAAVELAAKIPAYTLFADLFDRFPAHLHINVDPQAQGLGVGRRLVDAYTERLTERAVGGVHIVTAPDAEATGFYDKLGFVVRAERAFEDRRLLFMGRPLKGP